MRGMGGVSDQKQIAVAPASRAHGGKPDPAAVVGQQRLSLERRRKYLRAELDSALVAFTRLPRPFRGVHLTAALPGVLGELDDERAHRIAVRICVGLHGPD